MEHYKNFIVSLKTLLFKKIYFPWLRSVFVAPYIHGHGYRKRKSSIHEFRCESVWRHGLRASIGPEPGFCISQDELCVWQSHTARPWIESSVDRLYAGEWISFSILRSSCSRLYNVRTNRPFLYLSVTAKAINDHVLLLYSTWQVHGLIISHQSAAWLTAVPRSLMELESTSTPVWSVGGVSVTFLMTECSQTKALLSRWHHPNTPNV